MDFAVMGSVDRYARQMQHKQKWEQKKHSAVLGSPNRTKTCVDPITEQERDPDQEKLAAIGMKIDAGVKLTQEELDFLREKNPMLYEKVRQIMEEEAAYRDALRRCRSRDEVRALHMSKVTKCMQEAESEDGMPMYRLSRMTECMTEFTKTAEYRALPTDAQRVAARRKEFSQAILHDSKEPERTEEAGEAEKAQPEKAEEARPKDASTPSAGSSETSGAEDPAPREASRERRFSGKAAPSGDPVKTADVPEFRNSSPARSLPGPAAEAEPPSRLTPEACREPEDGGHRKTHRRGVDVRI